MLDRFIKQSLHVSNIFLNLKTQAHLQYYVNGFRRVLFLYEQGEQKPNGSLPRGKSRYDG